MSTAILPNSAFLHIPKTGGSWVFQSLIKMDLVESSFGHIPITKLKELTEKPVFAFVRNPVTWYQSRWSARNAREQGSVLDFKNKNEKRHFNIWVGRVIEEMPGRVTKMYKRYLGDKFDSVEHIGFTESLEGDLGYFLSRLKEKHNPEHFIPGHINKGADVDRRYDRRTLRMIIESEMEAMQYFNYPTKVGNYRNLINAD